MLFGAFGIVTRFAYALVVAVIVVFVITVDVIQLRCWCDLAFSLAWSTQWIAL